VDRLSSSSGGLPGIEDLDEQRLYRDRVEAQRRGVGAHRRPAPRPAISATKQQPLVRTGAVGLAVNRMPDRLKRNKQPPPPYRERLHGKLPEDSEPRQ